MAIKSRYLAYAKGANKKSKRIADAKGGSRKTSILGKMQHMKKEVKHNG